MSPQDYFYATGRRKCAVTRVKLLHGDGAIIIDGKPLEERFPPPSLQAMITQPLRVTDNRNRFDVIAKVEGGGITGQAGALRHGISRALAKADDRLKPVLRRYGLLTRDPRVKERKKYGLKRARKAPQYTKR